MRTREEWNRLIGSVFEHEPTGVRYIFAHVHERGLIHFQFFGYVPPEVADKDFRMVASPWEIV